MIEGAALRDGFHEAKWDEPVITTMGRPGARGVLPPGPDAGLPAGSEVLAAIPSGLRRKAPPALPELSQPEVHRHYARLSQMILRSEERRVGKECRL